MVPLYVSAMGSRASGPSEASRGRLPIYGGRADLFDRIRVTNYTTHHVVGFGG
jgi:hypothetical protein